MEVSLSDGRVLEHMEFGEPSGRPVVLFPGTPATAGCGALVHEAASAAGVRLVAVSRPGYGASSPSPPGLASVARDTVELLDTLGLPQVGVHGLSGGGPFALALGAVAPDRVSSVVVAAGPAPPIGEPEDARRSFEEEATDEFGGAGELSTAEFILRRKSTAPRLMLPPSLLGVHSPCLRP